MLSQNMRIIRQDMLLEKRSHKPGFLIRVSDYPKYHKIRA